MVADDIFGPDIGSLKGKTTRRKPHRVSDLSTPVPATVLSHYRRVTLCADIMFVNGIPMLVTRSRHIQFGTVEALPNRKAPTIIQALKRVKSLYRARALSVVATIMDGEFEPIRGDLADIGITLNETGRDEHSAAVERFIRTVKERMRATYNTLPFRHVPAKLIIEMAKAAVFWLNSFPVANGVSDTQSPAAIVSGRKLDYNRHCKYEFGDYVQTHEEHDNSMQPRTIGALALRPTGNAQGNWYFMSLSTGRVINRMHATKLPMPQEVIDIVHRMARRQKANPGLVFLDRNCNPLSHDDTESDDDDDDDSSYHPDDNDDDEDVDDNSYDDANEDDDSDYHPPVNDPVDEYDSDDYVDEDESTGADDDGSSEGAESTGADDDCSSVGAESTGADESSENARAAPVVEDIDDTNDEEDGHQDQEDVNREMDAAYGPRSGRYSLRNRKRRDYSHLFTLTHDKSNGPSQTLSTPQYFITKGLKVFGQEGSAAVKKELIQIHEGDVLKVRCAKDLTPEQKKEALAYLMFLKRKRCGKVKGRGCADGRKQRRYTAPEDATSPTVSLEAVLLTSMIDALEGREVAVVDFPGAFLQTDLTDEEVILRITGHMADLLVEIDPEMYEPFVVQEGKEKVLYVQLLKAMYGILRAARLFWEKLTKKLAEWGFEPNPYDSCVMNKMVNGKQLTAAWHVDDMKISHVDVQVVDEFITMLEGEFGKKGPLSISRGKVHNYLGMTLDFSKPGSVVVEMFDYIDTMVNDMPEDMRGSAVTPAANHLFNVNESATKLTTQQSEDFVHLTMQALYLSLRARPDIRTAVSFLNTRLQSPDQDDYKKLTRLLRYLQATRDMPLTLAISDGHGIQWWIDAAHGVHDDMKGHTGGTMSLGHGCPYSTSMKQKLVTRSSTECELVGMHDVLPMVLWVKQFLEAQGMKVEGPTIVHQDNQSAILLEKNGRHSSTKRTRHMNMRFFFAQDQIDKGIITIKYCPTEEMLADFFTKPLQGALFRRLRDRFMNLDPESEYHSQNHRSVLSHAVDDVTQLSSNQGTQLDTASLSAIGSQNMLPAGRSSQKSYESYKDALVRGKGRSKRNGTAVAILLPK
jgi:hypothetical protein